MRDIKSRYLVCYSVMACNLKALRYRAHNLIPAQQPIRTSSHLSCATLPTNQPISLRATFPEQDYGGTKPQTGSCKLRKTGTSTVRTTLFFAVSFCFSSRPPPFAFPLCLPAFPRTYKQPFSSSSLRTSLYPNQPGSIVFYPGVDLIVAVISFQQIISRSCLFLLLVCFVFILLFSFQSFGHWLLARSLDSSSRPFFSPHQEKEDKSSIPYYY